jgi:two-component system OmpR family sensor kinase
MPQRVRIQRKWRPPLALVIDGTLFAIFAAPIIGLTWLRLAGNILGWSETAFMLGMLSMIVMLVLRVLLWRLVLRPIWRLEAYAHEMKSGQGVPPDRFGTHELSHLGQAVIDMAQTQAARTQSQAAYADHVTHELKSPLTAIRGAVEMLGSDGLSAQDKADLLKTVQDASARMQILLDDLRAHAAARLDAQPGQTFISEALPEFSPISVTLQQDTKLPLANGDLQRVLTQLIHNAAEHGAREVTLTSKGSTLWISDDGQGIAPGDLPRIFDPFFTSKRDAGGTGMGLPIARTLIEAAGGQLEAEPRQTGACFRIEF